MSERIARQMQNAGAYAMGERRPAGRPRGGVELRGRATPVNVAKIRTSTYVAFAIAFGHRLREIRTDRGVAVSELAAALDCSIATVHLWERGSVPSMAVLIAIAGALHCSVIDLMPEEAHDVR